MDVLHLTEHNQGAVVEHVADLLKRGGVIAVPTDTVYGLVADALRESAVKKIFRIKTRSYQKALPVFVRDIAMVKQYAMVDAKVAKLLEELWPGKTTVVLRKKDAMPDVVTGGMKTGGFRIPDDPFIQALTAAYPHPLAETSANLSGSEPAQSPSEVQNTFHRRIPAPDLLVDGGKIASAGPSTVLDLTMPSNPKVLRMGAITKSELDKILAPH